MPTSGFCDDSSLTANKVMEAIKMSVQRNLIFIDKVLLICDGRIELRQQKAIKQFLKWMTCKKCKESFVLDYKKVDQCQDDEEKWASVEHMFTQFEVPVTFVLRRR